MSRFLFAGNRPGMRPLCAHFVPLAGHGLDWAEDDRAARVRAQAIEYDAIVADDDPLRMDGPAFLAEIRPRVRSRTPCALMGERRGSYASSRRETPPHGPYLEDPFGRQDLVRVCNGMLKRRVRWLLAAQPAVVLPPRSDGRWVEIEALEAALALSATACGRGAQVAPPHRVLRAPSPAGAIRCLVGTVRDWSPMLEPSAEHALRTVAERRRRLGQGARPNDPAVGLGDEYLRRIAVGAPEPLRTRIHLALCCARYGWRWHVDRNVELVSDPPVSTRQEDGLFHSDTGPALRYRDGWEVYALRGIPVAPHVIKTPERITIEEIRGERNAELRRLLRERFGETRYLAENGSVLIDVDTVPVDSLVPGGRSISRALLENARGRRFLVGSDGSTRRVYHMEVPPTCRTCQQAYEALSGRPGARTIIQA